MIKLVVDRKALLDALAGVMPAVARTAKLPSLQGVKITAGEGLAHLEATNLDLGLRRTIQATVTGGATEAVVVNTRRLATVVRRGLPAGDVTIALHAKRPSVAAGSTKVWLEALPVDEWPTRATVTGATVVLTAGDVAVIRRLAVAASDDWARPILHSVSLADGYAVATDSYRLVAARISATPKRPLLLPLEMVKVLPGAGVELVVDKATDGPVAWGDSAAGGWARLVAGDFPHWEKLMPEPVAAPLTLDRAAFLAAVVRAEAVISAHDRYCATPLRLIPVAGGIALGARDHDGDIFDETLGLEAPAGVEAIALNPRFLVEMLKALDGDRVRLSIRDSLKPVLITDDAVDAGAFRVLMMPVRVDTAWMRKAS